MNEENMEVTERTEGTEQTAIGFDKPLEHEEVTEGLAALDGKVEALGEEVDVVLAALGSGGYNCRICTGSYRGSGTYGPANPNSLSFPFAPQLVIIAGIGKSGFLFGGSTALCTTDGTFSSAAWNGNSITWHANNADDQLNKSSRLFHYAAFSASE